MIPGGGTGLKQGPNESVDAVAESPRAILGRRSPTPGDDWFEYNSEIVTDTAVGEAAYCLFHGTPRSLVSVNPSCWMTSPLSVIWRDNAHARSIDVPNYWDADELKAALDGALAPPNCGGDLETTARSFVTQPDVLSRKLRNRSSGSPLQGCRRESLATSAILHESRIAFDERGGSALRGTQTTRVFQG